MSTFGPYPATVTHIHDGDTFTVRLDLGFSIGLTVDCRLFGINAPELSTQAGKDALTFLEQHLAVGDAVTVVSHGWDKYGGRFDGQVTNRNGEDLSALMVSTGHAVVYP